MARFRPNAPSWVNDVLERHWDSLAQVAGPGGRPVRLSGGAPSFDVKDYGSGRFGCALPCVNRDMTLKLTRDASEAAFVAFALRAVADGQPLLRGFAEPYAVRALSPSEGKMVFAIWREEVLEPAPPPSWSSEVKYRVEAAIESFVGPMCDAFDDVEEGEDAQYLLPLAQRVSEEAIATVEIRDLAQSVVECLRRGYWCNDVRLANCGTVRRLGARKVVLFDMGRMYWIRGGAAPQIAIKALP